MSNDYFDSYSPLPRNQLARAEAVNAIFDAIIVGFDNLPDEALLKEDRVTFCAESGAVNAYEITPLYPVAAYVAGQRYSFVATTENTDAATLNVKKADGNWLGVKTIKRADGLDLSPADITVGRLVNTQYDGVVFQLTTPAGSDVGTALAASVAAAASEAVAIAQANIATAQAVISTTGATTATAEAVIATAAAATATAGATTATTQAGIATAGGTTATTEAAIATAAATTATTQAGIATPAAATATAQATIATTQAGQAATSAAAALVSETSAHASALAAAAVVGNQGRRRTINGAFQINERAYITNIPIVAGNYGHDRWKAGVGGATYTFVAAKPATQITITAGTLLTFVEDVNVEGGSYTLSWAGTSQARIGINGVAPAGAYAASPIVVNAANAGQVIQLEFGLGTLGLVQLEPGLIVTPFERVNYTIEFEKCRRYFRIENPPAGTVYDAANIVINIITPGMRTVPTIITPSAVAVFDVMIPADKIQSAPLCLILESKNRAPGSVVLCGNFPGLTKGTSISITPNDYFRADADY